MSTFPNMMSLLRTLGFLLMALLLLVEESLAKSLESVDSSDWSYNLTKRSCVCMINDSEGNTVYDHGVIDTFNEAFCHQAHHRCRLACTQKLQLATEAKEHHPLGLSYCNNYGKVTKDGPLQIHAEWHTPECKHHEITRSWHVEKLCCGFTTMPTDGIHVSRVLSWSPSCKGTSFVYGP